MSATILPFPEKKNTVTIRIPLYSEDELDAVQVVLNVYTVDDIKYTDDTMHLIDPESLVQCIQFALKDKIFSRVYKNIFKGILKNVQYVESKK